MMQNMFEQLQNEKNKERQERKRELAAMMAAFKEQREQEVVEQEEKIRNIVEKTVRKTFEGFQEAQRENKEEKEQNLKEKEEEKERKILEMFNNRMQKMTEPLQTDRERGEAAAMMTELNHQREMNFRETGRCRGKHGENHQEAFQQLQLPNREKQLNMKEREEKIQRDKKLWEIKK